MKSNLRRSAVRVRVHLIRLPSGSPHSQLGTAATLQGHLNLAWVGGYVRVSVISRATDVRVR